MPLAPQETRPRPAGRRVGYAIVVAANAALLIVLNAQPGWQEFSFLTAATPQVLGLFNASLAVSLAVNLGYLARDPKWLKSLGDLVTAALTLAVAIRLWQVFPFAFNGSAAWLATAVRVLLIVGLIGAGIAIVVQAVTLTLLIWKGRHAVPPQVRAGTDQGGSSSSSSSGPELRAGR